MKKFVFLKKTRVLIASVVLLLMTSIFLDIYHLIPVNLVQIITSVQLTPAFINLIKASGIVVSGFIVISVVSLIIGRVYCSTICPLGLMLDGLITIKKRLKRKKLKFSHNSALKWLPLSILIITAFALSMGNIQVLSLLDPYSNFGRILTILFKPLVIGFNNILYDGLINFNNYTLQPIDINYSNIQVFLFVLLFFIGLVSLSWYKGRWFCTHLCPVGAFLGVVTRFSFFKVKIHANDCTSCGNCERSCKAGCISAKDKKVDFSKCVMCFNCLIVKCPTDAITISSKKNIEKADIQNENCNKIPERRRAIKTLSLAPLALLPNIKTQNQESKKIDRRQTPISPPGSLNHKRFADACTACYLCVNACPSNAIKPSLAEYGLNGIALPQLTNEKGYCNLECTRCSDICPNGALLPVSQEEKKTLQIGVAHFVRERCVVITDGTDCGACSEHCPTKAVNMVVENGLFVPVINESICIGCGACEYACPIPSPKAIFIEGNTIHQLADKPQQEKLQAVDQEEEFPF